ncbi:outer membrane beta-barrel protein [Ascidiaceihabitans sp.]|uniref:outer membrane protein n=1 Tax=Ascidiaceihabitans sp. TaxID=1872644 RepID=UPI0032970F3B
MLYRALILTSAIILGLGAGAQAQDRWAGFYAGLSLDAVDTSSDVASNATHRYSDNGASLGLYAGYNYARANGFVWGPEIALTGINASGSRSDAALGTSSFRGSFLLNPRMRLGYATDRAFFYGMVGLGSRMPVRNLIQTLAPTSMCQGRSALAQNLPCAMTGLPRSRPCTTPGMT